MAAGYNYQNGKESSPDPPQFPPDDGQHTQRTEELPTLHCEKCNDFQCESEAELNHHHERECQERDIDCPKKCKMQFKAKDFENHIPNCAGLTKVDCLYKREGCDCQIFRCDMDTHLEGRAGEHLKLVQEDFNKMDLANADERDEIRKDVDEIKQDFDSEKEKLLEVGENVAKSEAEIEQNKTSIQDLFEMGQELKSDLEAEKTEIVVCKSYFPKIEGNESEIEKLKSRISNIEQHLSNFESHLGSALSKLNQNIHWIETAGQSVTTHKPQNRNVLVWSVDIAPMRLNPGMSVNSQRFFTSPKGYCISAKLLIGRAEVAPRHYQEIMCITVTVEHGEWDKMLKWPLSGFVSIELLNHNAPTDHYKPMTMMEFQQVEMQPKGKEGELAYVQIPLQAITQVPAKNCYLKNDIVHVRVMVNNNYKVPEWLL